MLFVIYKYHKDNNGFSGLNYDKNKAHFRNFLCSKKKTFQYASKFCSLKLFIGLIYVRLINGSLITKRELFACRDSIIKAIEVDTWFVTLN